MAKRRGAQPTALPDDYADFLTSYAAVLAGVPLAADTKRTYASRVRMYLAWLASPSAVRRPKGDPLANPTVRDWAVRDYGLYLLRDADPKPPCPERGRGYWDWAATTRSMPSWPWMPQVRG